MKKTKFAIESEKYAKENPFVEKGEPVFFSAAWEKSCDHCQHQEGRHYCLLHGVTVKNMDALCCLKWEERNETKTQPVFISASDITKIMANKAELARENEELRKALRDIVNCCYDGDGWVGYVFLEERNLIKYTAKAYQLLIK